MASLSGIDSLPNEILLQVLSFFSSRDLFLLTSVNRRFHSAAMRILQNRLARVATLPGCHITLECYFPSVAMHSHELFCEHLGTDEPPKPTPPHDRNHDETEPTLADLTSLYSHFRPVHHGHNEGAMRLGPWQRRRWRQQPTDQAPPDGSNGTGDAQSQSSGPALPQPRPPPPSYDIDLEHTELFTQLCTTVNLLSTISGTWRPFLSHANVSQGVIRVWRDWLATASAAAPDEEAEAQILWADPAQHVGARFAVTEIEPAWQPLLAEAGEEVVVRYRLEHLELLVRTYRLLLAMDDAMRLPEQGNALVIIPG